MKLKKRAFDLFWSLLGLATLWPLLLLIAICIKLEDGGPVFFQQERVGYRGRLFRIIKFRTMVANAEKLGKSLTVGGDPRITRIGYWLRKWKLDELPQLINVIKGEMSLVGPRPEVPRYVAQYANEQRRVLEFMPGITDQASVRYMEESELLERADDPEDLYIRVIMPEKIRLNLEYAQHASTWSDLLTIIKTLIQIGR